MNELTPAGQFATESASNNWANQNDDSTVGRGVGPMFDFKTLLDRPWP
jgi:hypothetical protein